MQPMVLAGLLWAEEFGELKCSSYGLLTKEMCQARLELHEIPNVWIIMPISSLFVRCVVVFCQKSASNFEHQHQVPAFPRSNKHQLVTRDLKQTLTRATALSLI